MSVVLLRLAGPLQAWGDGSRFLSRQTRREPTKSGVVGLLAAALGRPRDADVSDLAALEYAVRIDKPGEVVRDFQAARVPGQKNSMISNRYYLADAVFTAALGGDEQLIERIAQALKAPRWPLFLGRRSCPPALPLLLRVDTETVDVRKVLAEEPWGVSEGYAAFHPTKWLELVCDGREGEVCEARSDYPLSFDGTEKRQYGMRAVYTGRVLNPSFVEQDAGRSNEHDPMDF